MLDIAPLPRQIELLRAPGRRLTSLATFTGSAGGEPAACVSLPL
jgi:hypothetical protein